MSFVVMCNISHLWGFVEMRRDKTVVTTHYGARLMYIFDCILDWRWSILVPVCVYVCVDVCQSNANHNIYVIATVTNSRHI